MLPDQTNLFSQIVEPDYYKSRWQSDIKSSIIYIGMIFCIIIIAAWHDWILLMNSAVITPANKLAYILRGLGLLTSATVLGWLAVHWNRPDKNAYAKYIFIWELIIILMSNFSDIMRPRSYYLSTVVEIPVILSMYLVIPQHNRILRVLPPVAFSISLALIYAFYKVPTGLLGFGSLYLGLLFVNLIGIYFSDKMYANDYRLFYLSNIDELTGLYNRRYLKKKLQEEWRRCLRQQKLLALLLVDIDYFKVFNDIYGHQHGDDTIRQVTWNLAKNINLPGAFASRYGGEEFIIVLPDFSPDRILPLAEFIRASIEDLKIPHKSSAVSDWVTVSIGISSAMPNTAMDIELLIQQADIALYQAKNQGRNQVVLYDRKLSDHSNCADQ